MPAVPPYECMMMLGGSAIFPSAINESSSKLTLEATFARASSTKESHTPSFKIC
jgi:hypothetical protein